jgi:uncharacterized repeat protein (TIGR03803 family)
MLARNQIGFAMLFCAVAATSLAAQTFTTLASFNLNDGYFPTGSLVQGLDGNFYGVAELAGAGPGFGSIFRVTPQGTLTRVHRFHGPEGSLPGAGLVLAMNGDLYGTTGYGGSGFGNVFALTAQGTVFSLYAFDGADGSGPGALVQTPDGNFYGTTVAGGHCNLGTVFRMTPQGVVRTLRSFRGYGSGPGRQLVQGSDGYFYGTTFDGGSSTSCGSSGCGTIFKISPDGLTLKFLHSFNGPDGTNPSGNMVLGADGNLYGTAAYGGLFNSTCFLGCGTVFKITPQGTFTTIHVFDGTDGQEVSAGLMQATDGNLYGAAAVGGNSACPLVGCGTVFQITPDGAFTILHSFAGPDGESPEGELLQGTDGNLYGTTLEGGANHCEFHTCGTVFSISMGLGPFVRTVPTAKKVGLCVRILGTDLTGAAAVTFNGMPATFTIVSPTEITATVPKGATTGKVQVTTPSGILSSNVDFQVL